jgi:hypothetical protein
MERLASSGLHMSRLDVQRRMRPTISSLIRYVWSDELSEKNSDTLNFNRETLYPALEDHELVKAYPPVRGFAKNVFFLSHDHRENEGVEESASKYNMYEVGFSLPMHRDLTTDIRL